MRIATGHIADFAHPAVSRTFAVGRDAIPSHTVAYVGKRSVPNIKDLPIATFGSRRRSRLPVWCIRLPLAGLLLLAVGGCARYRPPRGIEPETVPMTVTGYCKCGKCCGWERNWRFQPVFNYGPQKGQRKRVGITASGTRARPGTIAADTRLYPFGTILYIEGYGYGRVEDRGGAIKGQHIDLFFRTHQQALIWGRQQRHVKVWRPQTR